MLKSRKKCRKPLIFNTFRVINRYIVRDRRLEILNRLQLFLKWTSSRKSEGGRIIKGISSRNSNHLRSSVNARSVSDISMTFPKRNSTDIFYVIFQHALQCQKKPVLLSIHQALPLTSRTGTSLFLSMADRWKPKIGLKFIYSAYNNMLSTLLVWLQAGDADLELFWAQFGYYTVTLQRSPVNWCHLAL